MIRQDELETMVLDAMQDHLAHFVTTGGEEMLAALLEDSTATSSTALDERALRTKLDADRKRLDELVECVTPSLVAVLEPKIVALRREIAAAESRLAEVDDLRASATTAQELVRATVVDAELVAKTLTTATFLERRDVLRALTHEIVLNPDCLLYTSPSPRD